MAKLVPPDATKASHKHIRDACKTCVLGANYGMQAVSLGRRIGIHTIEAQGLLRRMAQAFPAFTAWAESVIDVGRLGGSLSTVFGWRLRVTGSARSTTLRNFPMQSNGAEMLRLACCLATERGVEVCAPVHDAVLVEGPTNDMDRVVAETRRAMAEASRVVLDGLEIETDVDLIAWPDRYADPRGQRMWEQVNDLL
jgi:DNA polymerase I-like protein with 3'-5' exonuclease and polymerase domains